jgi:voltage-dependent potassium channel beta subunit
MSAPVTEIGMKYRFLGDSGLLVSVFGLGLMMQDDSDFESAYQVAVHAYKHGVNFWDNAELYGQGSSERAMGLILQRGIDEKIWTREDLVLTTKIFFGTKTGPNNVGIDRKHIIEGTKASLERIKSDYVDVLYLHRPEPYTPIEEIVRAMNFAINQGWAFYWGTSEWLESQILEAWAVADRLGLVGPIAEQPQYNLVTRSKVEVEYLSLLEGAPTRPKMGLTTWSPLCSGLLTGKYGKGIPEDARLANPVFMQYSGIEDFPASVAQVEKLRPIAAELGCSLAQLSLAWCATNKHVSTVMLGAKSVAQLDENLKAFPFISKITPEIKARIEAVIPLKYKASTLDPGCFMRSQYL